MSIIKNIFEENKVGVIITIIILIAGSIIYFGFGFSERNTMSDQNPEIYKNAKIKVAYTPDGNVKLFVNTKNSNLLEYKAKEGQNLPESDSIVIGFEEAKMMKEEKLFTNINDEIKNLFGVDIKIGGILKKTDSPMDDFHFVSDGLFEKIQGKDNKLFIKINDENIPKLFYNYNPSEDEDSKLDIEFTEGKLEDFKIVEFAEKTYYPLFIGSKEAKMMKEENIFKTPGDTISGLFGRNFVIVGVLKETNTSLDMMHFTPLKSEEMS